MKNIGDPISSPIVLPLKQSISIIHLKRGFVVACTISPTSSGASILNNLFSKKDTILSKKFNSLENSFSFEYV